MTPDPIPKKPEAERAVRKVFPAAALVGCLTLLAWVGLCRVAAAQDLFSVLAQSGVRTGYVYMDPRCSLEDQSLIALILAPAPRTPPPPHVPWRYRNGPPAQSVNVRVYPPPVPPRTVNVGVWPEPPAPRRSVNVSVAPVPVRKPVGTWTSGGYVLSGSVPAPEPMPAAEAPPGYPPPAQDISPTQEQLRAQGR